LPESPEIALISDVADEATHETSPGYCPHLPPSTANAGLNTNIQNIDVMSLVNLFTTNNSLEYVCEQTKLYASQVISAAPHPFTKHSLVSDMDSSKSTRTEKKNWGLMFVTGLIRKPTLKLCWFKDPVFETPVFSKTVARNRFESILSFLHFSDSSRYDISNWLIPSSYL
jgi:hypothetical protein